MSLQTKCCVDHNVIRVLDYNRTCELLKWTRIPSSFSKLLKPCLKGIILPLSNKTYTFNETLTVVFPTYVDNFAELFLRMTDVRSSISTNTSLAIYNWNTKYTFMMQPFAKYVKPLANIENRCFNCNFLKHGNALPRLSSAKFFRNDMRKILKMNAISPPLTKQRLTAVVALRSRRRFLTIKHFENCKLEFECYTAHMDTKVGIDLLANADIFVTMHGADTINAFALDSGAKIVEIMPIKGLWECPCNIYSDYAYKLNLNFTKIWSKYRSRKSGSYNYDVTIDWYDIRRAISSSQREIIANTSVLTRHAKKRFY